MHKYLEKTPEHEQWQNAKILLCLAHASTLNVVYLKANKTQFYVILCKQNVCLFHYENLCNLLFFTRIIISHFLPSVFLLVHSLGE